MGFNDSPVGGLFLIQPAIRSPNYVAGSAGWTINADGSAQFYNVVLIGSDLKILGTGGSYVEIHAVSGLGRIDIQPGTGDTPGTLAAGIAVGGEPQTILKSPQQNTTSPNTAASIFLQGASASTPQAFIQITADALQLSGLAGTTGVGSAFLDMGADQGSPAGVNLGIAGGSTIGMDGGGLSIADGVAINTGELDLFLSEITLNGNRCYVLTNSDNYDCSATQSLGGAFVAIPGMSHTYLNLAAGTKWVATVSIDGQLNSTAGNTMKTQLVVGGTAQGNTLDRGPAPSTTDTVSRTWSGTFVAGGTLSFAVNTMISGPGNVGNNVLAGNSTLYVALYQ